MLVSLTHTHTLMLTGCYSHQRSTARVVLEVDSPEVVVEDEGGANVCKAHSAASGSLPSLN